MYFQQIYNGNMHTYNGSFGWIIVGAGALHSDYVYLHVYPHLYALSLSTSVSIYPSLNLLSLQSTYPYLSLPLSLSSSVSIYPSFSLLSLHSTYPYPYLPQSPSTPLTLNTDSGGGRGSD